MPDAPVDTSSAKPTSSSPSKPLAGLRVVELQGLGPGPYAGMLLADLGAEVVQVCRPGGSFPLIHDRGKVRVEADLRTEAGRDLVLDLCAASDALFEGLRPGVAERLGVGPEAAQGRNPALVYGRMTGWGQSGPWAPRAGHDITYIALTGALAAIGPKGGEPVPPLNFAGDFGGGSLFLVMGMLAALLRARTTGEGAVVDAAMVDGAGSLMGIVHTLEGLGQWSPERGTNLIDGGRPFYRCYRCADGHYVAVGCIEPQFFAEMLRVLDIDPETFGGQNDPKAHPAQHARLESVFAQRSRDHWAELFADSDACVAPVLLYTEAAGHPQLQARQGYKPDGTFLHPRPAPVFDGDLSWEVPPIPGPDSGRERVFDLLGYSPAQRAALGA